MVQEPRARYIFMAVDGSPRRCRQTLAIQRALNSDQNRACRDGHIVRLDETHKLDFGIIGVNLDTSSFGPS